MGYGSSLQQGMRLFQPLSGVTSRLPLRGVAIRLPTFLYIFNADVSKYSIYILVLHLDLFF